MFVFSRNSKIINRQVIRADRSLRGVAVWVDTNALEVSSSNLRWYIKLSVRWRLFRFWLRCFFIIWDRSLLCIPWHSFNFFFELFLPDNSKTPVNLVYLGPFHSILNDFKKPVCLQTVLLGATLISLNPHCTIAVYNFYALFCSFTSSLIMAYLWNGFEKTSTSGAHLFLDNEDVVSVRWQWLISPPFCRARLLVPQNKTEQVCLTFTGALALLNELTLRSVGLHCLN